MGFYTLCWKSKKSKRKPTTRSVHTQTDNGSPQQSPPPAKESSPPSYPPPPVPTSRAPTDKGKGIVIEEGKKRDKGKGIVTENGRKKRDKGKGIVIDDGKKQHSSDSDFDTRSERSGTSRNYNPPYASNVENPPPPSDPPSVYASNVENPPPPSNPPSEYEFPYSYSENYNPQQGYPTSSYLDYSYSSYSQLNYHPDNAEISENDKLAHNIFNSFIGHW